MVATTVKAPAKAEAKKNEVKDGKKLPAVPESVLKHRKRRETNRAKLVQVNKIIQDVCDMFI